MFIAGNYNLCDLCGNYKITWESTLIADQQQRNGKLHIGYISFTPIILNRSEPRCRRCKSCLQEVQDWWQKEMEIMEKDWSGYS